MIPADRILIARAIAARHGADLDDFLYHLQTELPEVERPDIRAWHRNGVLVGTRFTLFGHTVNSPKTPAEAARKWALTVLRLEDCNAA